MKIVRVALAVPLPRLFDYFVPDDVSLQIGMRVLVPFGTQKRVAIVADFPTKSDCRG
ncbi:primosome factor n' [Haemophilus influenzae]|uniref:Primosome factor n n=1 Tax=Haemophilus influenzae TaxID=727 RepID=A0A2X1PNH2_HAEIF|nr:primosome factor n' [Haemophilus influenzae]